MLIATIHCYRQANWRMTALATVSLTLEFLQHVGIYCKYMWVTVHENKRWHRRSLEIGSSCRIVWESEFCASVLTMLQILQCDSALNSKKKEIECPAITPGLNGRYLRAHEASLEEIHQQ